MKRLFDAPFNNVNVPPDIVDLPEEQSDVNPAFKIIDVLKWHIDNGRRRSTWGNVGFDDVDDLSP